MEHRLIQGGEVYLPFARSAIRRLLATGLPYLSQRFILPDATIRVSIEPGHEYIEIQGVGTTTLPLDSGIVDIGAYLEANPSTWLAGTLYETDHVALYNAPFTLQPPDFDPPRLYPNPGVLAGQFSGILEPLGRNGYRGRVPVDGEPAQSFAPRRISNGAVPPVMIDDPADANLAAKKRAAMLCPASMFTGRARLYAQALYGAHEYTAANGTSTTKAAPFTLNDMSSGARPALVLNNRDSGAATVQMTSGSCVYLDPATGRHYLFTFEGGVRCFPLKSSRMAEKLRKYLITLNQPDGIEVLSQEDREHLEAYILSQSLPRGTGVDENGVAYADGIVGARFGMGYSWHWNWSGTLGDCVEHSVFDQGGGNSAMRAAHWRVTIAPGSGPGYFVVTEAVMEGPTDWAVYRSVWTITYPDWSTGEQVKLTPKASSVFACDAPLYAFYVGNDLKLSRVTIRQQPAGTQYREMSPYFSDSSAYGGETSSRWTYKFDGGYLEDHNVTAAYYEANFTCGPVSTGYMAFGHNESNNRLEVSEKEQLSWYGTLSSGSFSTFTVEIGEATVTSSPLVLTPNTWSWSTTSVTGTARGDLTANVRYHLYRGAYTVSYTSRITAVVPFYDAEAIYLEGVLTKDTSWNRRDQHLETEFGNFADAWGTRTVIQISGVDTYFDRFGWQKAGPAMESGINTTVLSDTTSTVTSSATVSSVSKLVSHAGVVDATFTNLSAFHDNNAESVGTPMPTVSGTRKDSQAVVIAAGSITAVGAPTAPAVPALVGWV